MKERFKALLTKLKALQRWQQVVAGGMACAFLLGMFLIMLRLSVSFEIIDDLPSQEEISQVSNPFASELYASNEKLIGKYFDENRSPLRADQLNDHFKNALLATEDIRFYEHGGVDTRSLLRVLFKTILLQKDASGGGSTLTQQLVKNLYPRKRYKLLSTLINKFREMSIAKRIEKVYTKDEILLLYANTVSFGERAFGLGTASQRFFNKRPEELKLEEAAVLVGLLKATTYYSPKNNPDRATKRRNVVIGQMKKYEFIDQALADSTQSLPLELDYQPISQISELARYFKQEVKREFKKWSSSNLKDEDIAYQLESDGLKIYTTLDYDLQIVAEKNLQSHMKKLQQIFLKSWEGGRMFGKGTKVIDDKILADPQYKSLRSQGNSNEEALRHFTTAGQKKVWTWDGYSNIEKTKIDSIKHYLGLLHAGIFAMDPKTGATKVWVGGNDYGEFQYDNIKSPRQVGSTFKPLVYLAALEDGKEPCDFFPNELRQYSSYQNWTPKNADGKYGGYASLKGALTHSINTISVQVLFDIGIKRVAAMARKLGISSRLSEVPSIVLGTSDISLFEMVNAYAVFANKGIKKTPYLIEKIEDKDGNILFQHENIRDTSVIDQTYIEKLNLMLASVTENGTGRRLYSNYNIPYEVKGKTGTTQNQSDGWFIGYTDKLVVGSWVGTQDRRIHFRNLGTGSGGRTALPLVGALFEYAGKKYQSDQTPQAFTIGDDYPETCPDTLSTEAYNFYTRRKAIEEEEKERPLNFFERLFGKRKRDKREDANLRRRQKQLEKERQERIKKYNEAQKAWEKRLQELKKKYGDN